DDDDRASEDRRRDRDRAAREHGLLDASARDCAKRPRLPLHAGHVARNHRRRRAARGSPDADLRWQRATLRSSAPSRRPRCVDRALQPGREGQGARSRASELNRALPPPQHRLRQRLVCMHVRVLLVFLIAAAFVPAASSASPLASGLPSSFGLIRTGPSGGTVWEGRILDRQVNDPRLSDVYLPPDFSPALRYPVVIFLHGFWGSPSRSAAGPHLAEAANRETTAGRARPFIAVMPPGGPMTKTTSDEWAGVWENYIIRDVVPWVDAHFLTVPSRTAIAGLSAGGDRAGDKGLRHAPQ